LLTSATDTNPAGLHSSRLAAQVLLALPWRASRITAAAAVPRKASDTTVARLADADPSFFPAAAVCPWRQAWSKADLPAGLVEHDVRHGGSDCACRDRPMPGIVANRRLASRERCQARIRFSTRAIPPRIVRS